MSDYDDPPSGHTSESYRRYLDAVEFSDQNDRNDYHNNMRQRESERRNNGYNIDDREISRLYRLFLDLRRLGFEDQALNVANQLKKYGYTV
jgi:hypothetical protein